MFIDSDQYFVSTQVPGLSGYNQPAFTAAGDMVVVAGSDVDTVYVLDAMTGEVVRTFGSTGKAAMQFDTPSGVCVTRDGNIIVADWGNDRLQEVLDCGRTGTARVLGKRLAAPSYVALTAAEDALIVLEDRPCDFEGGASSQRGMPAWRVVVLVRDASCTLRVLLTTTDLPFDPPHLGISGFSIRGDVVAVQERVGVVFADVSGKWIHALHLRQIGAPAPSIARRPGGPYGVGFDTRAPDDRGRLWLAFDPYFLVLALS